MTAIIVVASFLSVFSLFFGFAAVFSANSRNRLRCASSFVFFMTIGALSTLFEKSEFARLLESAIIGLAMAPVLALWLVTLRTRNSRNTGKHGEVRVLRKPHTSVSLPLGASHGKSGSKEADLSLQIK